MLAVPFPGRCHRQAVSAREQHPILYAAVLEDGMVMAHPCVICNIVTAGASGPRQAQ